MSNMCQLCYKLQKTYKEESQKRMLKSKHSLAEIIATKMCQELTSHMQYKSVKLKMENQRERRANEQAIEYTHSAVDQLRYLDNILPETSVEGEAINADNVQKKRELGFGRRVSIVKMRKSMIINGKNSPSNRSSRCIRRAFKESQRGVVKLPGYEEEQQDFIEYIEKLRQKKIKFAQVMQQFNRDGKEKENTKQIRSTFRETNHTDRPFITTFTGQLIKCQKKQKNSKKDELYLQKIRIRPLFKLRQHVSSRADLYKKGEMPTEAKRISISNEAKDENYKPKDDNYYIKSIIDVIANRKQMDNIRRRKNPLR